MFNQQIILKPSYLLTLFLLFIHLSAIIVIASLSISWLMLLLITVMVMISLIYNVRHYALRFNSNSITKIWLKEKEEWWLQDKQGNIFTAHLKRNSFRSLYWIVLNFKRADNKKQLSIVILPDSLNKEVLRRLRATLLFA